MGLTVIVALIPMASNGKPQSERYVFPLQSNGAAGDVGRRFGVQDKARIASARTATAQPAPRTTPLRAQPLNTKAPRAKNTSTPKRKTEQLTLWVEPIVKRGIQRIATEEGLTLSKAGAALMKQALQHHVDMHYHALLDPIIKTAIQKHITSGFNRLAFLLVRIAFAAEQTRVIDTNILTRLQDMPVMTEEKFQDILTMSQKAAKGNIVRTSPELRELVAALKDFLFADTAQEQGSPA
jgi:hypothetical protein